ncbi:MAG TPA: MFS transporter [Acidobacteriaceae bacterium]
MSVAVTTRSPSAPPCAHAAAAGGAEPCAPANRKWVLAATILGSALAFMDSSVVNVALPALQSAFHATSGGIQWVVQSYALFGAALLLLGGAIGDHYGRRRAYVWGVALFALASAGCAASFSLGQLVAARAVQGIGAALLIPQGLSILSGAFSGEERGRAIGTWSAWTSVFAAVGPVVGGWLLQAWSWRLIFVLNLPLALVVLALSPHIPESRGGSEGKAQPLDWLGAVLATTGFAAIVYALAFAPEAGWRNLRVIVPLVCGGVLLAAFLGSQAERANAMMPLSLFRIPRFLAANLLTFLLYGALGGGLYVIPFYVIQVRHYPPVEAGAVFLPMVAMMFFFSARVGAMAMRVGERWLMAGGAGCAGGGFLLFAALSGAGGYWRSLLPGVLLLGMGLTLAVAPLTTAVMSAVEPSKTGIASAVNNALSRLAGLVAVSVLVFVLAHGFFSRLGEALSESGLPTAAQQQMEAGQARLHDTPIPSGLTEQQHAEAAGMLDRAFFAGYRDVMVCCAVSSWLGALAVLVLLRERNALTDPRMPD